MLLIPAIDLKEGQCVRLRQGRMDDSTVFSSDPVAMAEHWKEQGARRLHIVDLDGAFAGMPRNGDLIRQMVSAMAMSLFRSVVAFVASQSSRPTWTLGCRA